MTFGQLSGQCPDNCPNVIFQEIVDNVKCGRDAPCRPQVSIPAIWNVIWGQTILFPIRNRPPNFLSRKYQTSKNWIQLQVPDVGLDGLNPIF